MFVALLNQNTSASIVFPCKNEFCASFEKQICLNSIPGCIRFRVCIFNLAIFQRLTGSHQEDEMCSASHRSNSIHSNGGGTNMCIGNGTTFSTIL